MAAQRATVIDAAASFIAECVARKRKSSPSISRPLFVGIQGPQGIGKSYLTNGLHKKLSSPPNNLRLAFLSLDDLYSTHEELVKLANENPKNKLLHGRGLAGTHDMKLGASIFSALSKINENLDVNTSNKVNLPIYDKSLFSGQGDRSVETNNVQGPIDVVIFEGWMVGFYPIPMSKLDAIFNGSENTPVPISSSDDKRKGPFFKRHSQSALSTINDYLYQYTEQMWPYLDAMIHLNPEQLAYTFEWRLEQEHNMKATKNGNGMTDEEVENFVARYMPAYELFGQGITNGHGDGKVPWANQYLKLTVDRYRNLIDEIKQFE